MLQKKVESVFLEARRLSTFTFNDTLVIAYETKPGIDIDYIEAFCSVLRHFELKSIREWDPFPRCNVDWVILLDNNTNTIMGSAVTDAAAWYDQADWIG